MAEPTEAKGDWELNARLAEQLLGWHVTGNRRGNWQLVSPEGNTGVIHERGRETAYPGYPEPTLPDLSGSWEGAGLVLEALPGKGWPAVTVQSYNEGQLWRVEIVQPSYQMDRVADSFPMAVALAAEDALKSEGGRGG